MTDCCLRFNAYVMVRCEKNHMEGMNYDFLYGIYSML